MPASLAAPLLLAACHPADPDGGRGADGFVPPAVVVGGSTHVVNRMSILDLETGKAEGVLLFDLRSVPAGVRPLVAAARAEDLVCGARAAGAATGEACARRGRIEAILKAGGWCMTHRGPGSNGRACRDASETSHAAAEAWRRDDRPAPRAGRPPFPVIPWRDED